MPSFTSMLGSNLQPAGPIADVALAVSEPLEHALRVKGEPIADPVQVVAMIDTGASGSVIQEGLAARLGLQPVDVTTINTPSSTGVRCYEYAVRIAFPQNNVVVGGIVIEAPLQGQNIQCLIDRDVLANGVLIYIGYSGLFSLSF